MGILAKLLVPAGGESDRGRDPADGWLRAREEMPSSRIAILPAEAPDIGIARGRRVRRGFVRIDADRDELHVPPRLEMRLRQPGDGSTKNEAAKIGAMQI